VLVLSVVFLYVAFIIFAITKELRETTYGKIVMGLLISVMISFIAFPFLFHRCMGGSRRDIEFFALVGTFLIGSWSIVMSFDTFMSFRW
jgi:Flp pilus assembly protein protease CpaA